MKKQKDSDEEVLSNIIDNIITTFKFYGVTLVNAEVTSIPPSFTVVISKQKRPKSLEETLDFVYWTLWTLIYGGNQRDPSYKIDLKYNEVDY